MYIKRIVIQGFKTYKNTTVIDSISPHHNVVIGRNGSGKSNFFAAIRFVLSDAYTHMTREERQSLIHEGSGTVMSAYVEIVFDNADRRFPIAKDEISIRRTIGLKKDDYSLDNKSATRSDVMNLLESAGFSRSNPYYIVPQGRITALTNSKDSERLALLKEVSGAKVFESKLKESIKEMNNSNFKIQRIDETLTSIDDRISDLQIESNDLKEYQTLERSKKILEYNIFDREANDLVGQIEIIDDEYSDTLLRSKEDLEKLKNREKHCEELKESINEKKISLKVTSQDKMQAENDYNVLLNKIADKKVKLDELKLNSTANVEREIKVKESIRHYESLLKHHESEISKFTPELQKLQKKEKELEEILRDQISKQRALYSKKNRFLKFENKKERDSWLKSSIKQINKELEVKNSEFNTLEKKAASRRDEIFDLNTRIEKIKQSISDETQNQNIVDLQNSIDDIKRKIIGLTDLRKTFWRDEIRLRSTLDSVANDLSNAENLVNHTMDLAQSKGISAIRSIAKKLNLENALYGPLAELFDVSDKYKTAVEVVAGNALFHVVVDNDKTAALIMDELKRSLLGRATFMPLNRLSPPIVEYPDSAEHQCLPLIKKLKYKEEVDAAVKQVFAKTIVCSDLQKGSELARAFKLNAVTLDGDNADQGGVLSGGFRNYKTSRLEALKLRSKKKEEFLKTKKELSVCLEAIENVNLKLTTLNNDLRRNRAELERMISMKDPLKAELVQLQSKKYNAEQELKNHIIGKENLRTVIHSFNLNLTHHKDELKSKFSQDLSETEQKELQTNKQRISSLEKELNEVVDSLSEVEANISKFEAEIEDNFRPHLEKLKQENYPVLSSVDSYYLKELKKELEYLNMHLDTADSKLTFANDTHSRLSEEIAKQEDILKTSNTQQALMMKKLENCSKNIEKTLTKKSLLLFRKDEIQKKIRELGILPEEAFQKDIYDRFSSDQLLKKLSTVIEKLSKFSHVNKKAMEQYQSFTKQRDDLVKRRQELEKSKDSIESLINNLKSQKDEAMTKSFKQVAKSFHQIFEQLVPAGVGNLVMQKKSASNIRTVESDEGTQESTDEATIDDYVGVAISASFNSKSDEQQRIEQFSGGQKSLCAIALILAIQTCDPAPFYLFDEIDANLDTQYRTSVAALINSLSHNAQFICTTFRPEMLQVADKFYGVMFNNKVSTVSEIDKKEATSFIEGFRSH